MKTLRPRRARKTSTNATGPWRLVMPAQSLLALLAAVVSGYRAILSDSPAVITAAFIAALLALVAAAVSTNSQRRAIAPLFAALLLELTILENATPPRLINAIPLLFATALALAFGPPQRPVLNPIAPTGPQSPTQRRQPNPPAKSIATVVSLVVLAPVGIAYLAIGLVAPSPDVYVSYLLYDGLITTAVSLAYRRSWWVVAMPPVSVAAFVLMVQAGAAFRGWSG